MQQSALAWLLDHTVLNVFRMLRVVRLPRAERGRVSWGFVATLAVTLIYGLLMLFSASYSRGYYSYGQIYYFIAPQSAIAAVGFVCMLLLSRINYRALRYLNESIYLLTMLLLLLALVSPADANGCHRWVYLLWDHGPSFQPSELAKFSMVLGTADYLDKNYERRKTLAYGILRPTLPLIPMLVLVLIEPHNSATMLILLMFGTMLFCGNCGGKWIYAIGAAGAAGVVWYLQHASGTVATRMGGVWGLNPGNTADMDWQTRQSIYAIASGGLTGVGIGNSVQKHQWLPYAENDFIFSIVCEELGFLGALAVIVLFALLIIQGVFIALRAPDFYGTMLGIGFTAQVAWQVFCHIGVVTALLPNTGISLPFFSDGGTSLFLLLLEMGVLLSVSRAGNARAAAQEQRERAELERRYYRRQPQH